MSFQGLDPETMRRLAAQLSGQATLLDQVAQSIDITVHSALDVWPGPDADDFSSWWASQHRPRLLSAARATHDAAQALLVQVQEQLQVSGMAGGAGSGAGHAGGGPGSGSGGGSGISVSEGVITLVTASGASYVFHQAGSHQVGSGQYRLNADGSLSFLGADGSVRGTVDRSGVHLAADGSLTLVEATGQLQGQLGFLTAGLTATGFVGAAAHGGLDVGLSGVHAGGSLFAGARGEVEAQVGAGPVGASARAEGWAGVGVEAHLDAGFEDGEFHLGGSAGAAVGVGGSVGIDITFDYEEAAETIGRLVDDIF